MHLCLFEDNQVSHLYPLTLTRPACELRLGIRSNCEALHEAFDKPGLIMHLRRYLEPLRAGKYALINRIPKGVDVLFVNGRYVPDRTELVETILEATRHPRGCVFVQNDDVVAAWVPGARPEMVQSEFLDRSTFGDLVDVTVSGARMLSRLWSVMDELRETMDRDFRELTHGYNLLDHTDARIGVGALLVNSERIYIGEGAVIRPGAILNAEEAPIYVDREAIISEGAVVHGPAYVGPGSRINPLSTIENTAIGSRCKIAGEVHDSIIHGYSNKAHAGFMGHSYIGRWCNLGADTTTSNLRNDYGEVSLYDAVTRQFEPSGRQFLGLILGDHSKCGVNSMFNTGTVVGVFCNLFGGGFLPRYVPSFSWGDAIQLTEYRLDKAFKVAEAVMARRSVDLTGADRDLLTRIFEDTAFEREAIRPA